MIDWKEIFQRSNFWAVQYARKAIQRAREKGKDHVTVKCAATPSGVLHIGNANEVIRSYFIAKSIEMLGFKAKVIYTSDDRDPLRSIPKTILDKDGNLISTPKEILEEFKKYFGKPVCLVPDPFKCHSSWSEHFLYFFFEGLRKLGILDVIDFEYYSPNVLYFNGVYDEILKFVLENKDKIEAFLREFKEHPIVYNVLCENCGRITAKLISFDGEKVEYICERRVLGDEDRIAEGCGYHGKTHFRYGKLPWHLEWAAQWKIFDADIEPFGKEHLESYKISKPIAEKIFGIKAPIPVMYEFFLVNGEKMSSSKGNVYDINFLLRFLEPEVILYLYTKRPNMQRNIDLKNIHLLVDEWDRLEEKVLKTLELLEKGEIDIEQLKDRKDVANYEELVIYYLCMRGEIKRRVKIPYTFAAIIGQLLKEERKIFEVLLRTGHITRNISEENWKFILERIEKASYWAKHFAPEIYKVRIIEEKVDINLDEKDKETLRKIKEFIENNENWEVDYVQTEIHRIIKETNDPKKFYKKLYKIFLGKEAGPKIGTLISVIGKEKALEVINRYL